MTEILIRSLFWYANIEFIENIEKWNELMKINKYVFELIFEREKCFQYRWSKIWFLTLNCSNIDLISFWCKKFRWLDDSNLIYWYVMMSQMISIVVMICQLNECVSTFENIKQSSFRSIAKQFRSRYNIEMILSWKLLWNNCNILIVKNKMIHCYYLEDKMRNMNQTVKTLIRFCQDILISVLCEDLS